MASLLTVDKHKRIFYFIMTLLGDREARELGPMEDDAWQFVEKFSPGRQTKTPEGESFDAIRPAAIVDAQDRIDHLFAAEAMNKHLDGDEKY